MSIITIAVYLCVGAIIVVPIIAAVAVIVPIIVKQVSDARVRNVGITAPAVVNSVRVGTAASIGVMGETKRDSMRWRVYFDVTVQPENESPFRAEFMGFLSESEKEGIESEKKIWVKYDPNDRSKVTFVESEGDRAVQKDIVDTANAYSQYAEFEATKYSFLRLGGIRCPAVIIHREKAVDVPTGTPGLWRFTLDVIPPSGGPFRATSLMTVQADPRFEVGREVFVRYNPADTTVVLLELI